MTDTLPPPPPRFRFQLRSLLALTTFVAMTLGAFKAGGGPGGVLFLCGAMAIVFWCRRFRFGGILFLLVFFIGLIAPAMERPRMSWTGKRGCPLTFHVVDSVTGQPIGGASVHVTVLPNDVSPGFIPVTTSSAGQATVTVMLRTHGSSQDGKRNEFATLRHNLITVKAPGYEEFSQELTEILGDVTLETPWTNRPTVLIQMKKLPAGANAP